MWIKTQRPPHKIIDTEIGIEIGIECSKDFEQVKILFVYPRLDSDNKNFLYKEIEVFDDYDDAKAYFNKLAEKLGAEEIKIDDD